MYVHVIGGNTKTQYYTFTAYTIPCCFSAMVSLHGVKCSL